MLQKPPDMSRVIINFKFIMDDLRDDRGGPYPGVQAVSDGPALHNVFYPLHLFLGEFRWPTAAMPFQQSVDPVLVPIGDPGVNA